MISKFRQNSRLNFNDIFYNFSFTTQKIFSDYHHELIKIRIRGQQILNQLFIEQIKRSAHVRFPDSANGEHSAQIYQKKQFRTQEGMSGSFMNPNFSTIQFDRFDSFSGMKKRDQQQIEDQQNINQETMIPIMKAQLSSRIDDIKLKQNEKQEFIMFKKENYVIEDKQYILTDYSSNQSSNQNQYTFQFIDQESQNTQPLFKLPVKSYPFNFKMNFQQFKKLKPDQNYSNSQPPSNFMPSNILNSAIKSNKKRLICRNKVIPKWAQELDQIAKNNKFKNPDNIFGKCIVQNLNLFYLFRTQGMKFQRRTSSAKWSNVI